MKKFLIIVLTAGLSWALPPTYLFQSTMNSPISIEQIQNAPENISASSPVDGTTVSLLGENQKKYMSLPRQERVAQFSQVVPRQELGKDGYKGKEIVLSWSKDSTNIMEYVVIVSEHEDFSEPAWSKAIPINQNSFTINNTKIATTYYCRIIGLDIFDKVCGKSNIISFRTEDLAPRLMDFGTCPNARDLGGRIGLGGRRVKQNMIFRCAAFDEVDGKKRLPINKSIVDSTEFADFYHNYTNRKEQIMEQLQNPEPPEYLPFTINQEWQVFFPAAADVAPEDINKFLGSQEIPDQFLNTVPQTVKAENDQLAFELKNPGEPAFIIQEFTAEKSGIIPISCGADWFWAISCNGTQIFNCTKFGNTIQPINSDNYLFFLPVKAGSNIIAFYVRSGMCGWSLHYKEPENLPEYQQVLKKNLEYLESELQGNIPLSKEDQPGENLVTTDMEIYFNEMLKLKTDLDLRSNQECQFHTCSPLGEKVNWIHIPYCAYQNIENDEGKAAFKKIFEVLTNESNYPLAFHCLGGQDRTGTLAFLLNGILGVNEEELWLDWEATGFYNVDHCFCHRFTFDKMMAVIDTFPGATIQEKCEWYALSCGISKEQIDTFRSIMLE